MENLNAEQVKKALECCASEEYICAQCPIDEKIKDDCECGKVVARNALALITSQEQRIGELTEDFAEKVVTLIEFDKNLSKLTEENEKLLMALANYDRLTDVRIAEEYYTAEDYEELREENERLRTESERLKARMVEALTEFAESVKRYYSALPGATVGAAVRFYVDEKLKEALDKI